MPMQVMYKVHANQHTGWGQAGVSEHLVGAHLPSPFIGLTICSLSGWLEGGPMGALTFLGHLLPQLPPVMGVLPVGQLLEDMLHVQL